jgi:hypothetical protein
MGICVGRQHRSGEPSRPGARRRRRPWCDRQPMSGTGHDRTVAGRGETAAVEDGGPNSIGSPRAGWMRSAGRVPAAVAPGRLGARAQEAVSWPRKIGCARVSTDAQGLTIDVEHGLSGMNAARVARSARCVTRWQECPGSRWNPPVRFRQRGANREL